MNYGFYLLKIKPGFNTSNNSIKLQTHEFFVIDSVNYLLEIKIWKPRRKNDRK